MVEKVYKASVNFKRVTDPFSIGQRSETIDFYFKTRLYANEKDEKIKNLVEKNIREMAPKLLYKFRGARGVEILQVYDITETQLDGVAKNENWRVLNLDKDLERKIPSDTASLELYIL